MSFSDVVRREFKVSDDERDKGLVTPADVKRYDNICYVKGGDKDASHYLDVYRPSERSEDKLPVIVNVHGGGWVYGDKETYQFYCMDLCRRGYAVVNASYRLAPLFKYPAQLEDVNSVFQWTLENADKYGFDKDKVYAVGDSAGANLLALFCLMCTNENYAALYDFKAPAGFVPLAVALNCGVYDVTVNMREMKGFLKEFMPGGGTDEELDLLNVVEFVNDKFPPSFIMTCYGDFLKNQAPLLEDALSKAAVPYVSKVYGSDDHPLKHVFHCDIRMKEAVICNDEQCRFFEEHGL